MVRRQDVRTPTHYPRLQRNLHHPSTMMTAFASLHASSLYQSTAEPLARKPAEHRMASNCVGLLVSSYYAVVRLPVRQHLVTLNVSLLLFCLAK